LLQRPESEFVQRTYCLSLLYWRRQAEDVRVKMGLEVEKEARFVRETVVHTAGKEVLGLLTRHTLTAKKYAKRIVTFRFSLKKH
jgi:uncharacterized NAD(P)/FAD-binding protein YdhS